MHALAGYMDIPAKSAPGTATNPAAQAD